MHHNPNPPKPIQHFRAHHASHHTHCLQRAVCNAQAYAKLGLKKFFAGAMKCKKEFKTDACMIVAWSYTFGRSKTPLTTKNLLEDTDRLRQPPLLSISDLFMR